MSENKYFVDLHPGKRYLLAFSGGADSVFLAFIMKDEYNLTLVHYDHNLDDGSENRAKFAAQWADRFNIPIIIGKNVEKFSNGRSIEEYAREKRYSYFGSLMDKFDVLLTAHHIDDQSETVLMRIANGSSIRGLKGIVECQPFYGKQLIRPILNSNVTKKQIYSYVQELEIPYIEDPTNLDNSIVRNNIRNNLIPYLQQEEEISIALAQLSEAARKAFFAIANLLKKYLDYDEKTNSLDLNKLRSIVRSEELVQQSLDLLCWPKVGIKKKARLEFIRQIRAEKRIMVNCNEGRTLFDKDGRLYVAVASEARKKGFSFDGNT